MEVPEATNRLLHEIKKALPAYEDMAEDSRLYVGHVREMEVEEALMNLIKAIQEEG